ncbi:hypothetical protein [Phytomonospora endophytica]|uniref:Uncharacterized protein n=1 Tax=Phytomonospora endophytica TaxID=714109 RepID=A0A841FWV2_9ACTN|nr:hypothetical protein [Phytomonospora endophytica]MBB6036959.1 hypothetical protein [Phytomonospora endophytica]GIG68010.1 hypothetical protein Pen01_43050 [Phytomonospora endophytica]
MRTKDGHTVGEGDHVWAVNGTGPYLIADAGHAGGLVYLQLIGSDTDGLFFAPGDLAFYICKNRPAGY